MLLVFSSTWGIKWVLLGFTYLWRGAVSDTAVVGTSPSQYLNLILCQSLTHCTESHCLCGAQVTSYWWMVPPVEKSKSQTLACLRLWMMITTAWTGWTSHHREQAPTGKTHTHQYPSQTDTVTRYPLFMVDLKGSTHDVSCILDRFQNLLYCANIIIMGSE